MDGALSRSAHIIKEFHHGLCNYRCVHQGFCLRCGVRHRRHHARCSRRSKAGGLSQLFINPDECIDCGNCVSLCAQSAIFSIDDLPADMAHFAEKNKAYFN